MARFPIEASYERKYADCLWSVSNGYRGLFTGGRADQTLRFWYLVYVEISWRPIHAIVSWCLGVGAVMMHQRKSYALRLGTVNLYLS